MLEASKGSILKGVFQTKVGRCSKVHGAGRLLVPRGRCVRFRGLCKLENVHGLQIKASFFQISSKACCGSEQLERLHPPLPETTAVSTTQSGHCYQMQIWSRVDTSNVVISRKDEKQPFPWASNVVWSVPVSTASWISWFCVVAGEKQKPNRDISMSGNSTLLWDPFCLLLCVHEPLLLINPWEMVAIPTHGGTQHHPGGFRQVTVRGLEAPGSLKHCEPVLWSDVSKSRCYAASEIQRCL